MLIFDVTDKQVKVAEQLVGQQLREKPESYAFWLDAWELLRVMKTWYTMATDEGICLRIVGELIGVYPEAILPIYESPYLIVYVGKNRVAVASAVWKVVKGMG